MQNDYINQENRIVQELKEDELELLSEHEEESNDS